MIPPTYPVSAYERFTFILRYASIAMTSGDSFIVPHRRQTFPDVCSHGVATEAAQRTSNPLGENPSPLAFCDATLVGACETNTCSLRESNFRERPVGSATSDEAQDGSNRGEPVAAASDGLTGSARNSGDRNRETVTARREPATSRWRLHLSEGGRVRGQGRPGPCT